MFRSATRLLGLHRWVSSVLPSSSPPASQHPLTSFFKALSPPPLSLLPLTRTFLPDDREGKISFGLPLPIPPSRIEYELRWKRKTSSDQKRQKSNKGGKGRSKNKKQAQARTTVAQIIPTVVLNTSLLLGLLMLGASGLILKFEFLCVCVCVCVCMFAV